MKEESEGGKEQIRRAQKKREQEDQEMGGDM